MNIVAATGHRPDKLGGYSDAVLDRLTDLACVYLGRFDPPLDRVISGMAQGWDTAVALAAIQCAVPLICAEPFLGQQEVWPLAAKQRYSFIESKAHTVYVVCEGGYAAWKMQKRNEWMVDHSSRVVALWNGTAGGTANCVAYAKKQQRPIDNLWEQWSA